MQMMMTTTIVPAMGTLPAQTTPSIASPPPYCVHQKRCVHNIVKAITSCYVMLCICTLGKVEIAVGAKLLKLLKSGGTAVKWRWSRSGDQIKLPRHTE